MIIAQHQIVHISDCRVMDLRWGIREQSHDNHTIIDFCSKEIERCKKLSIGPSFVVSKKEGLRIEDRSSHTAVNHQPVENRKLSK